MKDFDVIRMENVNPDRKVRIGGQELQFKAKVLAEDWARWLDGAAGTQEEYLAEMDIFILSALEPGQEAKWKKARDPELEVPLSKDDIQDLVVHIVEVVVGRPTVPPVASPGGESAGGTSSTDESQQKEET